MEIATEGGRKERLKRAPRLVWGEKAPSRCGKVKNKGEKNIEKEAMLGGRERGGARAAYSGKRTIDSDVEKGEKKDFRSAQGVCSY